MRKIQPGIAHRKDPPRLLDNVQAFIRRASRMADKTSWTKPRTGMTYWDSIVGGARLAARTSDGSRGAPDAGLGIPGAVDALGVDLDPKAAIVRLDQQNSPPSS